MIKPIIIIISFFLLPLTLFAQKERKNSNYKTSKQARKQYRGETWTSSHQVSIKYTPTSLLDSYGALLPLGMEYYFHEQYGVSFDVGFPLYYVLNNYRDKPKKSINSDYKLRLGVTQYFRLRERSRLYCGAEIFFRRQGAELQDSYLHFIDGNCYPYSSINVTKSIYGAGLLLGISRKLSEHLILEGHLGVGLRVIKMNSDLNKNAVTPYREQSFISIIPPNGDKVGDRDLNIYTPFAIKIGYLF
jgi:hypothetical protein